MPRLPEPAPQNGPRLAINLYDLDRIDPMIRGSLLGGKLDLTAPVRIDPERLDETAVAFSCDLLTAATVCDVIRSHDRRAGDYSTRVYLRRKAWAKLPSSAVLTEVVGGKVGLSHAVFGVAEPLAAPALPARGRTSL